MGSASGADIQPTRFREEVNWPGRWRTSLCLSVCALCSAKDRGSTLLSLPVHPTMPQPRQWGGVCTAFFPYFPGSPQSARAKGGTDSSERLRTLSHSQRTGSRTRPGLSDDSQAPNPEPSSPKEAARPLAHESSSLAWVWGLNTPHPSG